LLWRFHEVHPARLAASGVVAEHEHSIGVHLSVLLRNVAPIVHLGEHLTYRSGHLGQTFRAHAVQPAVYHELDLGIGPIYPPHVPPFPVRVDRAHEVEVDGHRLLAQSGCLESVGAMTENLDLAHLSISDRVQREVMKDDRDAALSASTTLANESRDATV